MDCFEFEWDEKKRDNNLIKHSIDFVRAVEVFFDEDYIDFESYQMSEERYQVIGKMANEMIILLVYTHRANKKRIISARVASKKERKWYVGDDNER